MENVQKPNAVVACISPTPGGLLLLRWKGLVMFRYYFIALNYKWNLGTI